MSLCNTGERMVPGTDSASLAARHYCAYRFAAPYVQGKKVLDIGSGEGYGAHYLAQTAASVLGIDYSDEAVRFARNKYQKANLAYTVLNAEKLFSLQKQFDVITCFQVIEHLKEVDDFLQHVRSLLVEGGIFICCTPNVLDASPNSSIPLNKFHVKEYSASELEDVIGKYFKIESFLGLHRTMRHRFFRRIKKSGLHRALPSSVDPVRRFFETISPDHFIFLEKKLDAAIDFLAVCVKREQKA